MTTIEEPQAKLALRRSHRRLWQFLVFGGFALVVFVLLTATLRPVVSLGIYRLVMIFDLGLVVVYLVVGLVWIVRVYTAMFKARDRP